MKRTLILLTAFLIAASCATMRPAASTYFTMDEMPDLVRCLPAPPAFGSPEFAYDSLRYFWGKEQRKDPVRSGIAARDAVWQLDSVFTTFNEAMGSRSTGPASIKPFLKAWIAAVLNAISDESTGW